jgi:hypothetical protein
VRVLLVLGLVGCGSGQHLFGGGMDGGGAGMASGGDGGASGSAGGGAGSAGQDGGCPSVQPLMSCFPTCTTPADCSRTTSGAFTASHFLCDGVCRYQGCNTDQECQDSFASTGHTYRCVLAACATVRFCQQACASAGECAAETIAGGAYGADNYACDDGLCRYTGCTSASECQTSLGASGHTYVCHNGACQQSCSSPADCALSSGGAYAADRYACDQGACRWLGCNSDLSCQQTFMSAAFACR